MAISELSASPSFIRRYGNFFHGKDFLLYVFNFLLNMENAHVFPPKKIMFSTRNRVSKRMHINSLTMNILSTEDTIMPTFIIKPKIIKSKKYYLKTERNYEQLKTLGSDQS